MCIAEIQFSQNKEIYTLNVHYCKLLHLFWKSSEINYKFIYKTTHVCSYCFSTGIITVVVFIHFLKSLFLLWLQFLKNLYMSLSKSLNWLTKIVWAVEVKILVLLHQAKREGRVKMDGILRYSLLLIIFIYDSQGILAVFCPNFFIARCRKKLVFLP